MKGFEDLKGKQLAVNRGTISDTWATQNAEKYGFEVQRYDTFPDSVQAVITRRAFTALNEIPTAVYRRQPEQGDQGRLQGLQRPQFRLRLPAREHAPTATRSRRDRVHEEGWHARARCTRNGMAPRRTPGSSINTIIPGWGRRASRATTRRRTPAQLCPGLNERGSACRAHDR